MCRWSKHSESSAFWVKLDVPMGTYEVLCYSLIAVSACRLAVYWDLSVKHRCVFVNKINLVNTRCFVICFGTPPMSGVSSAAAELAWASFLRCIC